MKRATFGESQYSQSIGSLLTITAKGTRFLNNEGYQLPNLVILKVAKVLI